MKSVLQIFAAAVLLPVAFAAQAQAAKPGAPLSLSALYDKDADVRQYKLNVEMSCRDEGAQKGGTPEQVAMICGCLVADLDARVPALDWKAAAGAAAARDERAEMAVMRAYHREASQKCRPENSLEVSKFAALGQKPPALPGTWFLKMPRTGCEETYRFTADGKVNVTSAREQTENEFKVFPPEDKSARWRLTITTRKDNRQPDCGGSTADDTGKSTTQHVFVNYAQDVMLVCTTAQGYQCFGPLIRKPGA
jgi:hypothetical protein